MHRNIIPSSTPGFPKWSLSEGLGYWVKSPCRGRGFFSYKTFRDWLRGRFYPSAQRGPEVRMTTSSSCRGSDSMELYLYFVFVLLKHTDNLAVLTGIWQRSWSMCGLLPYPEPVWNSVSPLGDNNIYRILYHHMNESDNKEAGLFIITIYTWHTRRLYWTHNSISDIPSTIYITPMYCVFVEGSEMSQVGIV